MSHLSHHTSRLAAVAATAFAGLLISASAATANVLTNPGFEADDASAGDVPGATGWGQFNDAFTTAAITANSGTQALKIYGPFNPGGGAGVTQASAANAGDLWTASSFVRNDSIDPIDPSNFALVQLQFLDAGGAVLQNTDSVQATSLTLPADTWVPFSASGIAPAGTVTAQIVLLQVQLDPVTGGSVFFDDANLDTVVPEPMSLGLLGLGGLTLVRRRRA